MIDILYYLCYIIKYILKKIYLYINCLFKFNNNKIFYFNQKLIYKYKNN